MKQATSEEHLLSALRKLQQQKAEQNRMEMLRYEQWRDAERLALRWGRTSGEVFGVMSLAGADVTTRVCAVGAEWSSPTLLDAYRIYLTIRRVQGEPEAAASREQGRVLSAEGRVLSAEC